MLAKIFVTFALSAISFLLMVGVGKVGWGDDINDIPCWYKSIASMGVIVSIIGMIICGFIAIWSGL